MGRRIRQHGGATSRHNQATFAFSLARDEAASDAAIDLGVTRAVLELDPGFAGLFARQRARVAAMDLRFVAVSDPELRTVFEVYAAITLGTLNTFDTH